VSDGQTDIYQQQSSHYAHHRVVKKQDCGCFDFRKTDISLVITV